MRVTSTKSLFSSSPPCVVAIVFVALVLSSADLCNGGKTSIYARKPEKTGDMPLHSDVFRVPSGHNAPQQVHITQGDHVGKAVIVSWVTQDEPGSNTVVFWKENSNEKRKTEGEVKTYKFHKYTSGYIHHCIIRNLEYNTKYYYEIGDSDSNRKFWFTTPPPVSPDAPYTFGIIGDLGQTFDSNSTITHYEQNPRKGQTVLYVGDLSYADIYPNHDNVRWDTWGRLIERSVAYQPWIWTAGNHEIDFAPELGETEPFKPYTHRYPVPYLASKSRFTPQYQWLQQELPKVNRRETPWLIVLMHAPWYNSFNYPFMEGETMRVVYEPSFVKYKVDIVFSGHVHAYERSERVSDIASNVVNGIYTTVKDRSAPVYITVGDGGNVDGLASNMIEPQPAHSAYRESSYGHAVLDIKNRTHAYYSWHRNHDGNPVEADTMWFFNRFWHPADESSASQ
ncbi:Purple acid phosphatase 2 [Hibiscus syriacus]|uniref:Purple acid phosphatase n=1 Tax=Hibiscus syriacus TaxID=106335 RepID=A0A6A3CT29_HIBSY|nr:Purple acid phosphatase 2 [Hibiscus syriacus]